MALVAITRVLVYAVLLMLHFSTAVTTSVSMGTIIEGDKAAPCPGELIIVKCSVQGSILRWRIGSSSFTLSNMKTADFVAGPNQEGKRSVISTADGDLIFYQNDTCIASNPADSSIVSELHFHLNGAKDFIEIFCTELNLNPIGENITIAVLDLPPPPPPKHLMQTFNNVVNETSYNMLRWTIEDKANVTHFILKGNNSRENISIHANTTNYLFTKDANATVTISLSSVGMCEQMSEIEEELTIDPDNGYLASTNTRTCHWIWIFGSLLPLLIIVFVTCICICICICNRRPKPLPLTTPRASFQLIKKDGSNDSGQENKDQRVNDSNIMKLTVKENNIIIITLLSENVHWLSRLKRMRKRAVTPEDEYTPGTHDELIANIRLTDTGEPNAQLVFNHVRLAHYIRKLKKKPCSTSSGRNYDIRLFCKIQDDEPPRN